MYFEPQKSHRFSIRCDLFKHPCDYFASIILQICFYTPLWWAMISLCLTASSVASSLGTMFDVRHWAVVTTGPMRIDWPLSTIAFSIAIQIRCKFHLGVFLSGGAWGTRPGFILGCAAPGSEPFPYFRESRTPKTYPILGKSHNPGHPKQSRLQKYTLF